MICVELDCDGGASHCAGAVVATGATGGTKIATEALSGGAVIDLHPVLAVIHIHIKCCEYECDRFPGC